MNDHIKDELLTFIKRHWKKAAFGSIIFLLLRLLLFAFVAWWILSSIMNRRQEFKESSEALEASFQDMSKAFEEDFKARKSSIEAGQKAIKQELDQKRSHFDKAFQKGRKTLQKRFTNLN